MANQQVQTMVPAQQGDTTLSMAYPDLASVMKVDFVFNDEGGVWLLHDQPLPEAPAWAEYDADEETVTLLLESGRTISLGLKIPARMALHRSAGATVAILHMEGRDKVLKSYVVPLITRNVSVN